MKSIRLGIIGVGGMGGVHAQYILGGKVTGCCLGAVCDIDPAAWQPTAGVRFYQDYRSLLQSGDVDACLVATPHWLHTEIGIAVLKAGLHLLVEKPIAVHKAAALQLLAAHRNRKEQVFSAMLNQRTNPAFIKIRSLIARGALGPLTRIHWNITDWFRTNAYYRSSNWRATWAGEGGGVLLNQAIHNLDLYQWMFGMPCAVQGFCHFGRFHPIEVEDDVTAYFEHPGGASGLFVTSTGESPGTNRLEVVGDKGRLLYENGSLHLWKNKTSSARLIQTSPQAYLAATTTQREIPLPPGIGSQHIGILNNFAAAILRKTPLIAPAAEGLPCVELANSILFSSLEGRKITLPLNADAYACQLIKLVTSSKPQKHTKKIAPVKSARPYLVESDKH